MSTERSRHNLVSIEMLDLSQKAVYGLMLLGGPGHPPMPPIGPKFSYVYLLGRDLAMSRIPVIMEKPNFRVFLHAVHSAGDVTKFKDGETVLPFSVDGMKIGDIKIGKVFKDRFMEAYPGEDITQEVWAEAISLSNGYQHTEE